MNIVDSDFDFGIGCAMSSDSDCASELMIGRNINDIIIDRSCDLTDTIRISIRVVLIEGNAAIVADSFLSGAFFLFLVFIMSCHDAKMRNHQREGRSIGSFLVGIIVNCVIEFNEVFAAISKLSAFNLQRTIVLQFGLGLNFIVETIKVLVGSSDIRIAGKHLLDVDSSCALHSDRVRSSIASCIDKLIGRTHSLKRNLILLDIKVGNLHFAVVFRQSLG